MDITKDNLRKVVLTLSWPAVARMGLNMLVQVIDLAMVGSLGAAAIAAVGVSNQIFFLAIGIVSAFSIGTIALVSQNIGANNIPQAKAVARQALIFTASATFILSLIGFSFAPQLISAVLIMMEEPDPDILALGTAYLRIISLSISFRFLMPVINGILQGAGNMRMPLYIMIVANAFNIIGNYFLIFGIGPFPRLDVAGAAIATALAGVLGTIMGLAAVFHSSCKVQLSLKDSFHIQIPVIKRILQVGIPAAIEQCITHGGQLLYTMLAASLGSIAIAANQIMMSAFSMTSLPCIGFAMVATTLVGQNIGAKKITRARAGGLETLRWAVIFTSLVGLVFIFYPELVIRGFTDDPEVIPLASRTLRILGLAEPALATALVLAGGLRGAGDTRWVMYITAFGLLLVRLGFSLTFVSWGWGLLGLWGAATLEAYVRACLVFNRFNSGQWAGSRSFTGQTSQSLAK
ncbi:MAG: MATE family efflux transporter [bacterium]|jgi:putative MATE family efflux protein